MKLKDMRKKDVSELLKESKKVREEIFSENVDLKLGKLKDTSIISMRKKDLARLMTVINEMKLLEEVEKSSKLKAQKPPVRHRHLPVR